jgi:hypothetical protein
MSQAVRVTGGAQVDAQVRAQVAQRPGGMVANASTPALQVGAPPQAHPVEWTGRDFPAPVHAVPPGLR